MRMNKYVPFLLAVALHVAAFAWFWKAHRPDSAGTEAQSASGPHGIDLSGFSTHHKTKTSGAVRTSPVSSQTATEPATAGHTVTGNFSEPSGSAGSEGASGTASGGSGESLVLSAVEPAYPPLARQQGLEGKVKLRAYYNSSGTVTKVDVIDSSGTKILDESAKRALSSWKLKSGAEGSFEKTFQFKLNE